MTDKDRPAKHIVEWREPRKAGGHGKRRQREFATMNGALKFRFRKAKAGARSVMSYHPPLLAVGLR